MQLRFGNSDLAQVAATKRVCAEVTGVLSRLFGVLLDLVKQRRRLGHSWRRCSSLVSDRGSSRVDKARVEPVHKSLPRLFDPCSDRPQTRDVNAPGKLLLQFSHREPSCSRRNCHGTQDHQSISSTRQGDGPNLSHDRASSMSSSKRRYCCNEPTDPLYNRAKSKGGQEHGADRLSVQDDPLKHILDPTPTKLKCSNG